MIFLGVTPNFYFTESAPKDFFLPFPFRKATGRSLKVLAVGACYHAGSRRFAPNDEIMIEDALEALVRKRFFEAPSSVHVAPVNLVYGHDALALKDVSADLFLCNLVYDPPQGMDFSPKRANWTKWTSARHFVQGAWSAAAKQTGARAIVTYALNDGTNEVDGRYFTQGGFYTLASQETRDAYFENEPCLLRREILLRQTESKLKR